MRPVVVTAILLLVVLMFMSDSEAFNIREGCKNHPPKPCRKTVRNEKWHQIGKNQCVKAFYTYKTHDNAEKACRGYGGHLVSVSNVEEFDDLMCTVYRTRSAKYHYWIGLKRHSSHETDMQYGVFWFAWTDGSKYGYTRWFSGQPDNFLFQENCVEMNYWHWGVWNDEKCWSKRPYVCSVRY